MLSHFAIEIMSKMSKINTLAKKTNKKKNSQEHIDAKRAAFIRLNFLLFIIIWSQQKQPNVFSLP